MSEKLSALHELVNEPRTRRAFGKAVVASGIVGAMAGVMEVPGFAQASGPTDVDILQFALNLEYLEAEFYTVATTGKTLAQSGFTVSGLGSQGDTTGGAKVALSGNVAVAAAHIARDEQMHVVYLQSALGSAAIGKPAINLNALGIGFNSQNEFITLARAFEDTGISAYGGAAPLIRSQAILAAAARIALTEAQHAGVLRYIVAETPGLTTPQLDSSDVPTLGSANGRLFQVDDQGLTTVRTPSQVLKIVLGGADQRGGFFPNGLNGAINHA